MQELQAIYDTRQSFYKKAMIEIQKTDFERTKNLYSYNTLVASIIWYFDNIYQPPKKDIFYERLKYRNTIFKVV